MRHSHIFNSAVVQDREEFEKIKAVVLEESPPPAPERVLLAAPTVAPSAKSAPEILNTNIERIEQELSAQAKEFTPTVKRATAKVSQEKEYLKKVASEKNDKFKAKAKEVEKEARSIARRYPAAVTGAIGLCEYAHVHPWATTHFCVFDSQRFSSRYRWCDYLSELGSKSKLGSSHCLCRRRRITRRLWRSRVSRFPPP